MKVTVIGSRPCPDTLETLHQLNGVGVGITFKDILSCHADLRVYLDLRDNNEVYAEIRDMERLGVPCFVCEGRAMTPDIRAVLGK